MRAAEGDGDRGAGPLRAAVCRAGPGALLLPGGGRPQHRGHGQQGKGRLRAALCRGNLAPGPDRAQGHLPLPDGAGAALPGGGERARPADESGGVPRADLRAEPGRAGDRPRGAAAGAPGPSAAGGARSLGLHAAARRGGRNGAPCAERLGEPGGAGNAPCAGVRPADRPAAGALHLPRRHRPDPGGRGGGGRGARAVAEGDGGRLAAAAAPGGRGNPAGQERGSGPCGVLQPLPDQRARLPVGECGLRHPALPGDERHGRRVDLLLPLGRRGLQRPDAGDAPGRKDAGLPQADAPLRHRQPHLHVPGRKGSGVVRILLQHVVADAPVLDDSEHDGDGMGAL